MTKTVGFSSRKRRRIVLAALAVIILAVSGIAYFFRDELVISLVRRALEKQMNADSLRDLQDGLHVGLCGAGSPIAAADRSGPCVMVVAGKRFFIIDAGNGSTRNINLMGFLPGQIEAVFLTHFHSDHIDGLGELMLQRWVTASNASPLPVYGPRGVERVVEGFNRAYEIDRGYRIVHHGPKVVPPSGFGGQARAFDPPDDKGRVTLIDDGGLTIVAFSVNHAPVKPAVGYKISYKNRTVVISGDTVRCAAVERESRGVDLLVHEAQSMKLVRMIEAASKAGRPNVSSIMKDIRSYHTSPEEAADMARVAGVKYLLLYHITPPLPVSLLEGPFLGGSRRIFSGPIRIGRDGDFVSLPAGSAEIKTGNRMRALGF